MCVDIFWGDRSTGFLSLRYRERLIFSKRNLSELRDHYSDWRHQLAINYNLEHRIRTSKTWSRNCREIGVRANFSEKKILSRAVSGALKAISLSNSSNLSRFFPIVLVVYFFFLYCFRLVVNIETERKKVYLRAWPGCF